MQNEAQNHGRAHVREHLIDPLIEKGMIKKRGVSDEEHKKKLVRIADKLSYMSARNLKGVCEFSILLAGGKHHNIWPDEISIMRLAYKLQRPPPRKSDYVQSLILSAMGDQAEDEGWLVELFQIARRLGPPPAKYIIAKLKDQARDNIKKRSVVKEFIAAGKATQQEKLWLSAYHEDLAECTAIRAAKAD